MKFWVMPEIVFPDPDRPLRNSLRGTEGTGSGRSVSGAAYALGSDAALGGSLRLRLALSPVGQKVYDAVVTRLIAAFYLACVKEVTTVAGVSNGVPFRARGVRVLEPG